MKQSDDQLLMPRPPHLVGVNLRPYVGNLHQIPIHQDMLHMEPPAQPVCRQAVYGKYVEPHVALTRKFVHKHLYLGLLVNELREVELPFRCVAMTSQPIPVRIFRLQAHELVIVLSRHAYVYVIVPRDEPLVTQYPYQRTANHIPPQSVSLANIHEEPENLHLRHLHFSNIVHRCLKLSFKKLSYPSNCLIFLAGLPTYTEFASKSFTTTDPAPTTVPLPMVTPGRIVTLAPIQQPSPITIGLNTVFLSALRFPLDI